MDPHRLVCDFLVGHEFDPVYSEYKIFMFRPDGLFSVHACRSKLVLFGVRGYYRLDPGSKQITDRDFFETRCYFRIHLTRPDSLDQFLNWIRRRWDKGSWGAPLLPNEEMLGGTGWADSRPSRK